MKMHLPLAVAVGAALPLSALALDAGVALQHGSHKSGAAEMKIVHALLTRYLDAVKGKHWAEAKQLLHPKTLAVIAEQQRLGREEHPMAPSHHEKEYYLKAYQIVGTRFAASAFVLAVAEDNYQVAKSVVVQEQAAYLVGKYRGKWYVVDKKRGESFSDESIKLGYPGYFDHLQFPREEEEED